MAKPISTPHYSRSPNDKDNLSNQVAEHGAPSRPSVNDEDGLDPRLEEGADAGTKGTGSAG